MRQYIDTVTDELSDLPIPDAEVFVYNDDATDTAAATLATLYASDGSTEVGNPLTTNAQGEYSFYQETGEYTALVYYGSRLRRRLRLLVGGGYSAAAASSAQAALAAAGIGEYDDTADGLAGTSVTETFWVDQGDGTGMVYRHDTGPVATALRPFILDPTGTGAADIFAGGVPRSAALAASSGAAQVGVKQGGTGATDRDIEKEIRERGVSIKQFGAVCDGVTDDSAAIQLAVNYCLASSPPKTLIIPGKSRMASSVNIDRPVGTNGDDFHIVGQGIGAGLHTTGNVTMFDSTLTVTIDPQSERVKFHNLAFSTNLIGNTSYVMSGKFLRVSFNNCFFNLIRTVNSTIYLQSWSWNSCVLSFCAADFAKGAGSYDCAFIGCEAKGGSTIFNSIDAVRGTTGFRFLSNLVEGLQDSTIKITGAAGVSICFNHIEGNSGAFDFNFFAGSIAGETATIMGNYIVRASGVSFYYGPMTGVFSAGNYQSGGTLHSGIANVNLISAGDSCPTISDVTLTNRLGSGLKSKGDALSSSVTVDAAAGKLGYATGAGGAVTQATSKATGVTLNRPSGAITLHNAALAAATAVSFTLTNSTIAATDVVTVSIKSGATAGAYVATVDAVAAGSAQISLRNLTAGSLGEAVVISFAVIKAVAA